MLEQSRCSTSQFMPLRVENNSKSVKQQILDFSYGLLIDIRKEALMSKVVQQVSLVGLKLYHKGKLYSSYFGRGLLFEICE